MTADELTQAAVDAALERALGPLAGRATATVEEAARLLGVGRSAAYDAARRGDLPALRVGGRWVVPVPALAAMLLGRPAPITAPPRGLGTRDTAR